MGLDIFNAYKKKKKSPRSVFRRSTIVLNSNISTPLLGAYLCMQAGSLLGLTLVDQFHHLVAKTSTPDAWEP